MPWGSEVALAEGVKTVDLPATQDRWDGLAAAAAAHHGAYRIVTWVDAVPEPYVADYCRLNEMFFDEAPMGELDLRAQRWDAARVRMLEQQHLRSGRHEVAAGALDAQGRLVALTEIAVNEHAVHRGFQSGTLVAPEHRGHRLGIATKVANHRQLRRLFPTCDLLLTGNADVNAPMNAVNDALGYVEVERCVEMHRSV